MNCDPASEVPLKYQPLNETDLNRREELGKPIYNFLKNYHDYSLVGSEKIDPTKNYLFIANHSLATYDFLLLVGSIYFEKNIFARSVVDNLLYYTPLLHKLSSFFQMVPGNFRALKKMLESGESILIAPGGMQEALRSSQEKRKILWERKRGFISLSITTKTPIILAACPEADDIYDVYKNPLTDFMYQKFKFPLPIAKGKNSLLPFLPKKIKLTHRLEGPFEPPSYEAGEDLDQKIEEFHAFLSEKMKQLLE